jgi:hypothetical protein
MLHTKFQFILYALQVMPLKVSERITNKRKILRRSGEGVKGRCLAWSMEEEGAYIFWMKQVPVIVV